MHLVFLNSLEKKIENGAAVQAQVAIQEEQGRLSVVWTVEEPDGSAAQDIWYEGGSWSDMLNAFQYRLTQRMADGYVPMIDGFPAESGGNERAAKHPLVLDFYSERHYRQELYDRLREWRSQKAKEEKRAPYMVATNRMLRMIAAYVPHTVEELEQVPGFGKLRCQVYGEEVAAITKQEPRDTPFPLNWVHDAIDAEEFRRWTFKQKEESLKRNLEQAQLRKSVLRLIAENRGVDEIAGRLDISMRNATLTLEELCRDGYDLADWMKAQWDRIPADRLDKQRALDGFRELGDKYLKPVLLKQVEESELEGKDLEDIYGWLRIVRLIYRLDAPQAA